MIINQYHFIGAAASCQKREKDMKNSGQKKTVKQNNKRMTEEKTDKKEFGISLRIQLIVGFVVPILFLIGVGVISYRNASSGMIENYENSAINALDMTMECLERGFSPSVANVLELANNTMVSSYVQGGYDSNSANQSTVRSSISTDIMVKQTTNDFIENIHIIPSSDILAVTTANTSNSNVQGFMNKLKESEDAAMVSESGVLWGSAHPFVDQKFGLSEENYILYCSYRVGNGDKCGLVTIDISSKAIRELMERLDFGEGSHLAFITADGRELDLDETVRISEMDFYTEGEDATQYVEYGGKEYFYMVRKSETTGGSFAVMVPKTTITQKADSIKNITMFMVLLACVAAVLLGTVIIAGIGSNITKSIDALDEVAQGNLVMKNLRRKNNEFGRLHAAIHNTVKKMRGLVGAVRQVIGLVSASGIQVNEASESVSGMVDDMSAEINEIGNNITREDTEIATCSQLMEELSAKIKKVNATIKEMIDYIDHTKVIVSEGMDTVHIMTEQSGATYQATEEVKEQVGALGGRLNNIVQFVDSIKEIADQTNLLSLNASIEAARAGESGRGFSVVAEEIRKLAESSGKTAEEIRKVVGEVERHAGHTSEKVKEAEQYVEVQEKTVQDTAHAFDAINRFIEECVKQMEEVAAGIEDMNTERRNAMSAMRRIHECSEESVKSVDSVKETLEKQIVCAETLRTEAEGLKEHMQQLDQVIAAFKLEA